MKKITGDNGGGERLRALRAQIANNADALQTSDKRLTQSVKQSEVAAKSRNQRDQETLARRKKLAEQLTKVRDTTSAICNDMLAVRDGDSWSLSFAAVANQCVAALATASLAGDEAGQAAMIQNLRSLSNEIANAFPQGRITVTDWKISVEALDVPSVSVEPVREPHPYAQTISKQVLTLRDSGFNLREFRQLFVLNKHNIHVIRPA
jgi:hypothetical protein